MQKWHGKKNKNKANTEGFVMTSVDTWEQQQQMKGAREEKMLDRLENG